jgi:hypothetical protein
MNGTTVLGIEIPTKATKKAGSKVYLSFEGEDAQVVRDLRSRGVDVEALAIAFFKKALETFNNANPQTNPQVSPQNNNKK